MNSKDFFDLDFGAITIDTNIIRKYSYDFESGYMALLDQFKNSPIKVIQSEIVHRECVRQMSDNLETSINEIGSALKKAERYGLIDSNVLEGINNFLPKDTPHDIADKTLRDAYKIKNIEVIDVREDILRTAIDSYFNLLPPFEKNEKKSKEFPDSFALLSIEQWAKESSIKVIAVSEDKGWLDFSKSSSWITVVQELPDALSKFQNHTNLNAISKIMSTEFDDQVPSDFLNRIEQEFHSGLESSICSIDADSYLSFTYDLPQISISKFEIEKDSNGKTRFNVVKVNEDHVYVKVSLFPVINTEVDFSFYVHDSIDNDDVYIGYNNYSVEENIEVEALIAIKVKYPGSELSEKPEFIDIDSVSFFRLPSEVSFGSIEPYVEPEHYR